MINIAVCDDDVQFAAALEEKILDYGKRKGVRLDTEVFSDGESFRQAVFNDNFYDLVYMDVEMGKSDGIYTVWEVKKKLSEVLVIYVTSHDTYFTEMFETEPFRYLKKPLDEEKFEEYFTRALERIQRHYFTYSSRHVTFRIPFRDVLYLESYRRQIILHGKEGSDTFYHRYGKRYGGLCPGKGTGVSETEDTEKYCGRKKSFRGACKKDCSYGGRIQS